MTAIQALTRGWEAKVAVVPTLLLASAAAVRIMDPRHVPARQDSQQLWRELELDEFWSQRLLPSRKGTRWSDPQTPGPDHADPLVRVRL